MKNIKCDRNRFMAFFSIFWQMLHVIRSSFYKGGMKKIAKPFNIVYLPLVGEKTIIAFVLPIIASVLSIATEKHLFSQEKIPEEYLMKNASIQWEQRDGELHIISIVLDNHESIIECLEKASYLPYLKNLAITQSHGIQGKQVEYLKKFKDLEGLFILGINNKVLENGQALSIKDTISAISHISTLKTLVLKEITVESSNDFSGLEKLVNLERFAIGRIRTIPSGSFMWVPKNIRQYNIGGKLFQNDLQHILNTSNVTFLDCIFVEDDADILQHEALQHLVQLNLRGVISKKMILSLKNTSTVLTNHNVWFYNKLQFQDS